MQNIVDTLYPNFAKKELSILKRIREIFPDYYLQNVIDEYNFESSK